MYLSMDTIIIWGLFNLWLIWAVLHNEKLAIKWMKEYEKEVRREND